MQLGQSMLIYQQQNLLNPPSVFKKISNYVFRFDEKIGQGNFSKVYKGQHQLTNQTVAIKIIQLSSIKSPKLQELLFSEIQVIQNLNHPNILKCYEVLRSDHNCYIITELCNGGDLQTLLKKDKFLNEQAAIPYLKNIYEGLLYLGERGIVHRDLKIANIFLHNGVAKIADFGFAKYTNNQNFKDMDIGSPLYMSPQGMIDHVYGMKTDIWSFGIIIYELLHGCNPFGRCQTQYELKNAVLMPLQNYSFRSDISRDVINLIRKCLQINCQARPNASALLSDPFISSMMNKNQNSFHQQKRIQWADHIAQTNYYIETPQLQGKKHPSSQQKIFIENEDNMSRYIARSYNMIPNANGGDTSISRQPIQQLNRQSQIKFRQPPQMNLAQTKNSPNKFLQIPQAQNKKRLLSPNNSESNINYRSNQTPWQSQKNSVNNSFSGKPSYIKSSHITPNRKQQLYDTTIMNSHEPKNKNQLSGSKNSNDSWASHNPNSNKKVPSNFNMPRGSHQEEIIGRSISNTTPQQQNLQFLINQNRLQLQRKQQNIANNNNLINVNINDTTNYNSNINKDIKPSNMMLNSVPVNRQSNDQKQTKKFQFSSGKKFGELIKGQKRIPSGTHIQQNSSNNNISSNKQPKQEQKIVKSKSHMADKSINLSIYTGNNTSNTSNTSNINMSTNLQSPIKNYSQTTSNYFPRQKQFKPVVNNNINQRSQPYGALNLANVTNVDARQRNNVVSTVIQFKQAVGLLHYCRLLFRFITTLRKLKLILTDSQVKNQVQICSISFLSSLNNNMEQQEIISRYLITVLDELLRKIKLKGIIYQGDTYKKKQLKETKLIEVAEEYFRKYVKQINRNRKNRQIIAVYDASTTLEFFKIFSGQFLFNLQKSKSIIEDGTNFGKVSGETSKIGQVSIQVTNLCYLGIRLCQSTQVIQRCFLHKNYRQLANLTIQNWLAQQNYSQKQYQGCLKQRQRAIKLLITLLKGSQTNDTQQNNRNYHDIQ